MQYKSNSNGGAIFYQLFMNTIRRFFEPKFYFPIYLANKKVQIIYPIKNLPCMFEIISYFEPINKKLTIN